MMKTATVTKLVLGAALLAGCGKKEAAPATTASFSMELEPMVGTDDLQLNTATYTKSDGQTFTVSKFKFLLSNIVLKRADGSTYAVPDGYYLVDAATPATEHFVIDNVPVGDYNGVSFLVGVDAAHNNASFTSGALSHSNDLYWEWSNEYVFLKMAGASAQAGPSGGRALTFDIGGANTARTVTPSFGSSVLPVKVGHEPEIHLSVNLLGLFQSATPANNVDFHTTYSVESGSAWAPTVADNYAASMFAVEHVHAY